MDASPATIPAAAAAGIAKFHGVRHVDEPDRTETSRFLVQNRIGRQAAALAYYLLFAIFPFLIFISSLLGMLELDLTAVTRVLAPLLPDRVVNFLTAYLG